MNGRLNWAAAFALVFVGLLFVGIQPAFGGIVGPIYLSDGVTVYSPVNTTYNTRNILFNYTVGVGIGSHLSLNYTLDGTLTAPMPYTVVNPHELHVVSLAKGQVELPELSEGSHTLTISMQTNFLMHPNSYVNTIYFNIDLAAPNVVLDAAPPNITIQTPQTNQTYTEPVPLNVLISEPTTPFTVSIDGNRTITLPAQNTTLTGLNVGVHGIHIQANDFAGNPGYSNYVHFVVTAPTPTPVPTSTPTPFEPTKPPQANMNDQTLALLVVGCCVAIFVLVYLALKSRSR